MLRRVRRAFAGAVIALVVAPVAAADTGGFTLELRSPPALEYGKTVTLRGRVVPTLVDAPVTLLRDGVPVGLAKTNTDGRYAFRVRVAGPATYSATAGELSSASMTPAVRPRLTARIRGAGLVGRPLRFQARLVPAGAGRLRVEVWRNGRRTLARTSESSVRFGLRTRHAASYRVRVAVVAEPGYASRVQVLRAAVVHPRLGPGSRGASVRALEQRLRDLHYALPGVDAYYGRETVEAVLAFQKVVGLARTGRVDAHVWRRLMAAGIPRARYAGDHIEVSKGRQVLFFVRNGRVELAVHVSTGATGNTPLGRWRVYRKVPGWDWVLWYPMYFLRGFAIHGYPSVPAYPASHGCVRVPMWIAPRLYATNPYGQTIYVYW